MSLEIKRLLIAFFILVNFAVFISFSNFFVFERGIAEVDLVNYSKPLVDMHELSNEGKIKNFYVENFNSAYGDGTEYMKMALGEESFPPYSLRPFYPKFIGSIAEIIASILDKENTKATQLNLLQPVMSIFNSLFLAISTIFMFLAIKKYLDDELLSALLALGLIVNVGTIQTSQFFMLDVISYCVGAIAIYFFAYQRYLYLSITIGVGILVKEVIVIYSLLLLYPFILDKRKWIDALKLLIIPISIFVGLRLLMNVDPLSMQYGWNISKGEYKLNYLINHLGGIKQAIVFGIKVFFAFGILWFFAFSSLIYKEKKLIIILFLMLVAIIFANALLASRVPRVIFVMFPAIVILSAIGINQILKKNDPNPL
ncbi:hypothetical protein CRU94_04170 [Arcobacter sp. AHV-9/2010]|uniref:hypothetical protein n=1 Tax=Arcobacter sp. AHV-9/2010 TaxID=2021861 RepID=UPI00100B5E90|nr:hypothetical protein [Arcobacter sp. CECT 9299]RXJ95815.1 hypothetical protein CRU94_04170 [Arcobacter sp. CECT 9299]